MYILALLSNSTLIDRLVVLAAKELLQGRGWEVWFSFKDLFGDNSEIAPV